MTRVEQCGVKMVWRGEEGCSPAQPLWAHLALGRGCRGLREVTETEGGGWWGNIHPDGETMGISPRTVGRNRGAVGTEWGGV